MKERVTKLKDVLRPIIEATESNQPLIIDALSELIDESAEKFEAWKSGGYYVAMERAFINLRALRKS